MGVVVWPCNSSWRQEDWEVKDGLGYEKQNRLYHQQTPKPTN